MTTTETVALDAIARAIDLFPHLTQNQRAELFSAIDLAPASVPDPHIFRGTSDPDEEDAAHQWYDAYYKSPAARAWQRVRQYWMTPIDPDRPSRFHMTLDEASGYESCPTQPEILKALDRAARYVRSNA